MTIAIDIDGVIVDTEKYILEECPKYFDKKVIDIEANTIPEMFKVTYKQEEQFWIDKYKDYCQNGPVFEDVREVTNRLHEKGYRILIVTARYYRPQYNFASEEEYFQITREHLIKNGIYFDELYFEPRPKVGAVEKYGIDIFIDDDPYNVDALEEHTKVIFMETKRKDYFNPDVLRASNWLEIERIIEENR